MARRKPSRKRAAPAGRHERAERKRQARPPEEEPAVAPVEGQAEEAEGEQRPGPAARSMWSGTISFGLVSVPVALYPAVRTGRLSLRMLDEDGTPLARRYWCPEHHREIHPEHIVRGYEVEPDRYIVVSDQELEALEPDKSRDIDLRLFVDVHEIDPIYFDRPYFLVPAGGSTKAYRLLAQTMEETNKAGIATFVMRDREYLIAILAERGLLRAQTMRFAEEIRSPQQVGLPEPDAAADADVSRVEQAIRKLTRQRFDPIALRNDYEDRLLELVQRKAAENRDVVETQEEAVTGEQTVHNLMAALEQSIRSAKRPRRKSA